MRFDLADLRLFLLVVEGGSITRGAARANLALPSASERLRGMEEVSGVQLLERGRRGVLPTAAGDALAHHARLILRQVDQMRGELGTFAKGLKGKVGLLANTAAISEFLPEALAPFLASHPHIDIDLKERLSTEIVKAVAGGLSEVGVISDAVDSGSLSLLPFAVDRLVLVIAPNDPLGAAKRLALADAAGREFIGLTAGSPLQDHVDEQAARLGTPLKFRVRVRTFEGICRMAAQGVGVGIVSETAARRCRRSMKIRSIRLTDAWATRRLMVCTRSPGEMSPHARALADHLGAAFRS